MSRTAFLLLAGLCISVAFYYLGTYVATSQFLKNAKNDDVRLDDGNYSYISPLLDTGEDTVLLPSSVTRLKESVERVISETKNTEDIDRVSVYYRDLKNGPRFSINESDRYTPASLLKVPMMIATYKYAAVDRSILNQTVSFDTLAKETWFPQQETESLIVLGKTYSIEDLVEHMIIHSDNGATQLLNQTIPLDITEHVFRDFDVPLPPLLEPRDPFITVTEYANFFRILYNATYLPYDLSEKALSLLAQSSYQDGFRSGITDTIQIASKFGIEEDNTSTQLHECGIIYERTRPFILCVMTEGNDLQAQTKLLEDISRLVYRAVTTD